MVCVNDTRHITQLYWLDFTCTDHIIIMVICYICRISSTFDFSLSYLVFISTVYYIFPILYRVLLNLFQYKDNDKNKDKEKPYRKIYIQLDNRMSYQCVYIHKNINCTMNMNGKTRKKRKVANNAQTYT